jgi:hypothetical protein
MFSAKDSAVRSGTEQLGVVPRAGRRLLPATAVALVAALGTYVVARITSGDLLVNGREARTPVPWGAVVVATAVGGLAAWAVVRIAGRTRMPRATFLALVVVGFAVSAAAPVAAAVTATTAAWLLLLHLIVAVPLVVVGWRLVRSPA